MKTLSELLASKNIDICAISTYMADLLDEAVINVNMEFSPRRLAKQSRDIEPLPTDTRQLSSYRTRIGTMLEYALSTSMQRILTARYGDKLLLTFATSHEYPDFYLRDNTLASLLKIEMKAVDAESDEQAARFGTPTNWIDEKRDLLLLVGWEWKGIGDEAGKVIGEYPYIFANVILPAAEIARERDRRLQITGGKIEGGKVFVFSPKKGKFVPDPGNYGKFWRIVHSSRRYSNELSEPIQQFMKFLGQVDERSPRSRLDSATRPDS